MQITATLDGELLVRFNVVYRALFDPPRNLRAGDKPGVLAKTAIADTAIREWTARMETNLKDTEWKASLSSENGTLHPIEVRVSSLPERERTYLISILPDLIDALGGENGNAIRASLGALLRSAKQGVEQTKERSDAPGRGAPRAIYADRRRKPGA